MPPTPRLGPATLEPTVPPHCCSAVGTLGMSLQRRPLAEVHDCKIVVEPCIWSLSFSSVSSLSIYQSILWGSAPCFQGGAPI